MKKQYSVHGLFLFGYCLSYCCHNPTFVYRLLNAQVHATNADISRICEVKDLTATF